MSKPNEIDQQQIESADRRVNRWQRKLLDLTLRNRLLNFKATLQTVPILCNDIGKLEDSLADNRKLKLVSRPEIDSSLTAISQAPVTSVAAERDIPQDELASPLPPEQLDRQLTLLYRASRSDLSEGGSNTLFVAIGFLRWKKNADGQRTYRAPLLLVPVKLIRSARKAPFRLQQYEDPPRFNATLIQMLLRDFGVDLRQFETELPRDSHGIDVSRVIGEVSKRLQKIPFMEIIDESAIGRFSFAKYLLWKDLVDRTDQLKNNRVVRHLLQGDYQTFASDAPPIETAAEIEQRHSPQDIYHPLDADSSQLSAIMAASNGNDLVMVGPPGTGKSQTIANIIAQCLATGKTVLFVAEKNAALNVVHNRLVNAGLKSCCLELHSNKAERKTFLRQLKHNWETNQPLNEDRWLSTNNQLKRHRDYLNDYADALNNPTSSGWSAFDAFWESVYRPNLPVIEFDWSGLEHHSEAVYQKTEATLKRIAEGYKTIELDPPLPMLKATDWSVVWETKLLENAQSLVDAAGDLQSSLTQFATAIGINDRITCSVSQLENMKQLATSIAQCKGLDTRFIWNADFKRFEDAADQLCDSINRHEKAKASLSISYDDSFHKIPLEDLEFQWRQACEKFWPWSWFARRSVQRRLRVYADLETLEPPDTVSDLKAIRTITDQQTKIANNVMADKIPGWRDHHTDAAAVQVMVQNAARFSNGIDLVGSDHACASQLKESLAALIAGEQSNSVEKIILHGKHFQLQLERFTAAAVAFEKSAGASPFNQETADICHTASQSAATLLACRSQIKRWTLWSRLKVQAKILGVSHAIKQLESNTIAPAEILLHFRNSYARWLVPILVDRTPSLRNFQRDRHEQVIADFLRMDAESRNLAVRRIRETIAHGLPQPDEVPKKSELGLLRHQMGLKRPSKSIRDVVTQMPKTFSKLAPCLLMSPLSIAQYLPADHDPLDIVIFDEASQITTWDAIGAIARGKQTIVVGDPQQLPPTNFFSRQESEESSDDDQEADEELTQDSESILEEAAASGLPKVDLNWHYRSRHESLIAFSNRHYYENRLITFPSMAPKNNGVSLTKVAGAIYDRGKSRTNRIEAEAVVAEAVGLMRNELELPDQQRSTLGVITFNTQQQSLIEDLFDHQISQHPELGWFFSDDRDEPTFVKNLENVQGDERDVIFFSITFGPTVSRSRVSLNFGAINREGGYRRLNVAITRARKQLRAFTSFDPHLLASSENRGPRDLKHFLQFADDSSHQGISTSVDAGAETEKTVFEKAVIDSLSQYGWKVVRQIGGTRGIVDFAIVHPDDENRHLAGIICDSARRYDHTVGDREKTTISILEGLGWNILRIWTASWWHDPIAAISRLDQQLQDLIDNAN